MSTPTVLAYIPVLHQGYLRFFDEFPAATTLLLLPSELANEFTPTHKEIRALPEDKIVSAIQSWNIFETVTILDADDVAELKANRTPLAIPDELVTTKYVAKYLPDNPVKTSSIFLRWDKAKILERTKPHPDKVMELARIEGLKSSDWWRQVGAVALRDGKVIAQTHNTHLPDEQQPYAEGDARAHFHKGEEIELTTAIHAEAKLIGEAAKVGISLAGCELYVTDFPCPTCAKLVAAAGFAKLYYQHGYTLLDGERVLRSAGVKLAQLIPEELVELADESYVKSIKKARLEHMSGDVFTFDEAFEKK
ncbi:MAG: deaminase [bacterium]|nr:deaminase [bacterium]